MDDAVVSEKQLFEEKLLRYYEERPNKKPWLEEDLNKVAQEILIAKATISSKTRRQYYLLKKYDVITVDGKVLVIRKMKHTNDCITYVTPFEEIYDKLKQFHLETGHGSRDKIIYHIDHRFQIPRPCIELFLETCLECQRKKQQSKIVVKPTVSKGFMARGQVYLIDFQSIPDGDFRFILNYQDHATKYICLRPLISKKAEHVATELINIFLNFGAPSILQCKSDNGREFCSAIIEQMKILWPNLHIVHGLPRHPQSQGSIERSNQDVENMLRAWMSVNKSSNWARGCMFVQWQKNTSFHRIIGCTPYKAVFGIDPVFGWSSCNLPSHVLSQIKTEEQLEEAQARMENALVEVNVAPEDANPHSASMTDGQNTNELMQEPIADTANGFDEKNGGASTSLVFQKCLNCEIYVQKETEDTCEEFQGFCMFCKAQKNIEKNRQECFKGQKREAEKLLTQTKKLLPELIIGDCVLLNIDKVERGPANPQNLVCVITDIKNGVYQLGTKNGIIKSWFNRSDLQSSASDFITVTEVNKDKYISVREAVAASLFGGQGFIKCSCQPSKIQCRSNRCLCLRKKLLCNSRCHRSGACVNN